MRLSDFEKTSILNAIHSRDSVAKVYLFGSRTENQARGGDIDLLVISEQLELSDKIDILIQIKDQIGEQKIDLLVKTSEQAHSEAFVQTILNAAQRLS